MKNEELQFQFQKWLSDKRQEADKAEATKPRGQLAEFQRGRSEAFSECFWELIKFIDKAKERE